LFILWRAEHDASAASHAPLGGLYACKWIRRITDGVPAY
jgi:hypothetical protein